MTDFQHVPHHPLSLRAFVPSCFFFVCAVSQAAPADDPAAALDRAVASAAEAAARAVVAIEVERNESAAPGKLPPVPPLMPGARTRSALDYYTRPRGPVSGVVLESDGLIATTYYNILGDLRRVTVTVGGEARPATLLGWSELHDVALLKIDAHGLPTLAPAKPETVAPGRACVLVGRSPAPERPTVTWGVVSALHRWEDTALQVDAEMSYGSAGGAVVDRAGRLLGIASHVAERTVWGQSSGVGFVTKLDKILEVLPRLKAGEKIEWQIGYLGVSFTESEDQGVPVVHVAPDRPEAPSPAAQAGLKQGDILLEFAGKPCDDTDQLIQAIRRTPPGTKVKIKFKRGDSVKETEATLIKKPVPD